MTTNNIIDYTKQKERKGMGLHPIEKCGNCGRNGLFLDGWYIHKMTSVPTDFCGWVKEGNDSRFYEGETKGKRFNPLYPGYGLRR